MGSLANAGPKATTIRARASQGRQNAPHGRTPATGDGHGEHDGEGLHHLDGARQERCNKQQGAVHRISSLSALVDEEWSLHVVYTTNMTLAVANATDSYADRVAERAEDLAPAERHVALSLADLGPEAALLTAAALAEELGTSDATVVRTAKSLGYSGLADLRRALTTQSENPPLGERLRRTLEQTPSDDPLSSAVRNHLSELDSLGRNVSPASFLGAVALLANSNRIVWRGVGPSAGSRQLRPTHLPNGSASPAPPLSIREPPLPTSSSPFSQMIASSCSPTAASNVMSTCCSSKPLSLEVPVGPRHGRPGAPVGGIGGRDPPLWTRDSRPVCQPRRPRWWLLRHSCLPLPRPTARRRRRASPGSTNFVPRWRGGGSTWTDRRSIGSMRAA